MSVIAGIMIANSVMQGLGAINDISGSSGRKEAIQLRAQSQKLALDYQKQQAQSNVLKSQIDIDRELQDVYSQIRLEGVKGNFNTIGNEFAVAREGAIVKQNNQEQLKNMESAYAIENLNIALEQQQGMVSESNRILQNIFSLGSSVAQGYGAYTEGRISKTGSSVSSNVQNTISTRNKRPAVNYLIR